MARTRLVVTMHKGDPHELDFETEEQASAALEELLGAMNASAQAHRPTTIAGRLVVRPAEVRSAELTEERGVFVG